MNAKTLMTTALAGLLATAAHAITSEEIAAALDVDPSIGTFSTGGDAEWYVDSGNATNGISCMRSGAISVSGYYVEKNSTLSISLDVREASYFTFWVKTSCYDSSSYAALNIKVGDMTISYCGEKEWQKVTIVLVPGQHIVSMMYYLNSGYYNNFSGMVWVDNMKLYPIMEKTTSVSVSDIKCVQRTPWNGMVDIDYTVKCEKSDADIWVYPVGYDKDSDMTMAPRSLTGDGVNAPVKAGTHRMTWKVTDDYPDFNSTAFTVKMTALVGAAPYMVVDLSGGVDALSYPVTYLSSVPAGGWSDEYKTTKMVFRLIPSGSFMMGSPSDEVGRGSYEDLHGVVLTKPLYMGVFECTQKQYELVMGSNPAGRKGDQRPVERVSYNTIRGSVNGAGWPTHNQVDANSFMGRLRSKVNMFFDLPTEAQWEYACRAGTSTALNSGKPYDGGANCNEVARWSGNRNDGKGGYSEHTKVGCYLANAWGIYDMHGNVGELCRDYWQYSGLGTAGVVDPIGFTSGYDGRRGVRGGRWCDGGIEPRTAYRGFWVGPADASYDTIGFRVMCSPVAE